MDMKDSEKTIPTFPLLIVFSFLTKHEGRNLELTVNCVLLNVYCLFFIYFSYSRQTNNSELDEYLAKISEDDEKEVSKGTINNKICKPV